MGRSISERQDKLFYLFLCEGDADIPISNLNYSDLLFALFIPEYPD